MQLFLHKAIFTAMLFLIRFDNIHKTIIPCIQILLRRMFEPKIKNFGFFLFKKCCNWESADKSGEAQANCRALTNSFNTNLDRILHLFSAN